MSRHRRRKVQYSRSFVWSIQATQSCVHAVAFLTVPVIVIAARGEGEVRVVPTARVVLNLSERCENACTYCFARGSASGAITATVETSLVVEGLSAMASATGGAISIYFFGRGEPTLNMEAIVNIVDGLRANLDLRPRFHLTTNGCISSSSADWIQRNIDSVTVSLDGPFNVHDRQRPHKNLTGTYHAVMRTIAAIGDRVHEISCTVVNSQVTDLISFFENTFSRRIVRFQPVMDVHTTYCGSAFAAGAALVRKKRLRNKYVFGDVRSAPAPVAWRVTPYIDPDLSIYAFVFPVCVGADMTRLRIGTLKADGPFWTCNIARLREIIEVSLACTCADCSAFAMIGQTFAFKP